MNRNQEKNKINIQQYVTDFFQHIGAMVEIPTYALLEVLLPEEYSPYFQDEDLLRLAFDPEVAEEEEAPLVIPGSPILDTINGIILKEEKILRRTISVDSTTLPGHILEKICQHFTFHKCRLPLLQGDRLEEHHLLVFIFHVSLISDERVEHIEQVPMDLHLNVPHLDIREHLETAFYQRGKNLSLPMPPLIGLEQAMVGALKKAEELARGHKGNLEKRLKMFKEEEMEKLRSFYNRTENEMKEKMEKLDDSEKHQKKRSNLINKLKANDLDRQRRIEDIEEKFSCKIELKLHSLIHYNLPKRRIYLKIQQRQETHNLEILYNPLTYQIEEPICHKCKKRIRGIIFKDKRALCLECGEG